VFGDQAGGYDDAGDSETAAGRPDGSGTGDRASQVSRASRGDPRESTNPRGPARHATTPSPVADLVGHIPLPAS
jgi:hypothetical protein